MSAGEGHVYVEQAGGHFARVTQQASADQAVVAYGHAACYAAATYTTTITVAGTYYKAGNTTTSIHTEDFTHASNKLTYTGAATGYFTITCSMSIGYSGGAGNKTLSVKLAKNGAVIDNTAVDRVLAAAADRGAVTVIGLVELAQNDYIEVFVTNQTDTQGFVADKLYLIANSAEGGALVNQLRTDLITLGLIKGAA